MGPARPILVGVLVGHLKLDIKLSHSAQVKELLLALCTVSLLQVICQSERRVCLEGVKPMLSPTLWYLNMAIENGRRSLIYPLKTVIFHRYVC